MVGNLDLLMGNEAEELRELEAPAGELYLKFKLASGTELALPAVGIAEVMSVTPDLITPIPNVSPLLLGVLNFRGEVVWVADLGQFLGDSSPLNLDRSEVSVITVTDNQGVHLGMAVNLVVGMEWLETETLQSCDRLPDEMAPFISGEWNLPERSLLLRLLDPDAIIRSSRWAA